MRNVLRVVALDKTTDFLFFLSKLLIAIGMSACTFIYFTSELFNQHFPNTLLHYPFAQVVFIFIGSYFIASVFFGVYSMAVDTLFLCFCELKSCDFLNIFSMNFLKFFSVEDCERNDDSDERPYFMSKGLKKLLKKSDK
jgi:solute carrier family 44 (choline transporter-like protein), member 2/4/5